ncbi:6-phosphogluconolactonase [Rubricella aquisinus]|uniref:6-phosphogluconolactonase n=1 Tax=Rubricella aquisinus TaxID=2028108 RepID=A0A840X462_9RHOB|nr:6-phosphogluconolactonase [Rubricella aquisinus]MBB5516625.1 6-phosphogluconolactonase [Rubricella aquisinus]
MTPRMVRYDSRAQQAQRLARTCVAQLSQTIEAKGHATLAVPGGSTPGPFLEAMSREKLDWSVVRVMLTDERLVPADHDRANAKLLRETLLQNEAAAARLIQLNPTPGLTPEEAAAEVTEHVLPVLPLDVCVLGMGADMHTASLFPGGDRLAEALAATAPTVIPMRAPGAAEPRLTLTAPVLQTATHIHILIQGQEKHDALDQALATTSALEAPIRAILAAPAGATVHYAD